MGIGDESERTKKIRQLRKMKGIPAEDLDEPKFSVSNF